jgi:hypothetical protein
MSLVMPLLAAGVPRWIWAALLMAAVLAVTVLTMWLVRYPIRRVPPPRDDDDRAS